MNEPRLARNGKYWWIMQGNKKLVYLGTVKAIAEKFGVKWEELLEKNSITPKINPKSDEEDVLKEIEAKDKSAFNNCYTT